ncbi:hypothetical protein HK098_007675 [Nowakowskiella sp. JEL0407]|nr:hypothetical protein HK098_007675 [Nowakowskiella sp. JEL0407]
MSDGRHWFFDGRSENKPSGRRGYHQQEQQSHFTQKSQNTPVETTRTSFDNSVGNFMKENTVPVHVPADLEGAKKQLKVYENRIDALTSNVNTLTNKLSESERSRAECERKYHLEVEKYTNSEKALTKITQELKQKSVQLDNIQLSCVNLNKKLNEESKNSRRHQFDIDQKVRRIEELENERSRILDEKLRLNTHIRMLETQLSSAAHNNSHSQSIGFSSDTLKLQQDLDSANRRIFELERETKQRPSVQSPGSAIRRSQSVNSRNTNFPVSSSDSGDSQALISRINQLESEVEGFRRKQQQSELTINNLENEKIALIRQRDRAVQEGQEKSKGLESDLREAKRENADVTNRMNASISSLNREHMNEKRELIEKIERLDSQNKDTQKHLRATKEDVENKKLALQNANEKLKSIEADTKSLQKEFAVANGEKEEALAKLRDENKHLKENNGVLESKIATLKEQELTLRDSMQVDPAELQNLRKEIENLNGIIEKNKVKMLEIENEMNALRAQIVALQKKEQEYLVKIEELKVDFENKVQENNDLTASFKNLKEESDLNVGKLLNYEVRMEEMKGQIESFEQLRASSNENVSHEIVVENESLKTELLNMTNNLSSLQNTLEMSQRKLKEAESEAQALSVRLDFLEINKDDLDVALKQTERDLSAKIAIIEEHERKLVDIKCQFAEADALRMDAVRECDQLKQEKQVLADNLAKQTLDLKNINTSLRQELEGITSELGRRMTELSEADLMKTKLEAEIHSLQTQLKDATESLELSEQKLVGLQKEVREQDSNAMITKEELGGMSIKLAEVEKCESQLRVELKESEWKVENLEAQLKTNDELLSQLRTSIEEKEFALRSTVEESVSTIEQLNRKVTELNTDVEMRNDLNSHLESEIKDRDFKLSQMETEKSTILQELSEAETKTIELTMDVTEMRRQRDLLQQSLDDTEATVVKLQSQVSELQSNFNALQLQSERSKIETDQVTALLSEEKVRVENLIAEKAVLQESLDLLEHKLALTQESDSKHLSEAQISLDSYKEAMKTLEINLEKTEDVVSSLIIEKDGLESQLVKLNQQITAVSNKLNESQSRNEEFSEKLEQAFKDNDNLFLENESKTELIKKSSAQIIELQTQLDAIQTELAQKAQNLDEHKKQLDFEIEEKATLKVEIATNLNKILNLDNELQTLKRISDGESNQLKLALSTTENNLKICEEKLAMAERSCITLQADFEVEKLKLKEVESKLDIASYELDLTANDRDTARASLKKSQFEVDRLKILLSQLDIRHSELSTLISDSRNAVVSVLDTSKEQESRSDDEDNDTMFDGEIQRKLSDAELRYVSMNEENQALQLENRRIVEELEIQIRKLTFELDTKTDELQQKQQMLNSVSDEREKIKMDRDNIEVEQVRLRGELTELFALLGVKSTENLAREANIEKLQIQLSALERTNESLESKLSTSEEKIKDMTSDLESASTDILDLREEKKQLEKRIETHENEIKLLSEKEAGLIAKNNSLSNEITALQATLDEFSVKSDEQNALIQQLESTSAETKAECERLVTVIEEKDKAINSLQTIMGTVEQSILRSREETAELNILLSETTKELTLKEAEIQNLQKKVSSQVESLEKDISAKESLISKFSSQIEEMSSSIETQMSNNDILESKLEEHVVKLNESESLLKNEISIRETIERKCAELESEIMRIDALLKQSTYEKVTLVDQHETETASFEATINGLHTQIEKLNSDLKSQSEEIIKLESRLDESATNESELVQKLKEADLRIEGLNKNVEEHVFEKEAVQKELEEQLSLAKESLKTATDRFEGRIDELLNTLHEKDDELKALRAELEAIKRLKAELNESTLKCADFERKIELMVVEELEKKELRVNLEGQISDLSGRLSTLERDISNMAAELTQKSIENEKLSLEASSLQNQLQHEKERIRDMKVEHEKTLLPMESKLAQYIADLSSLEDGAKEKSAALESIERDNAELRLRLQTEKDSFVETTGQLKDSIMEMQTQLDETKMQMSNTQQLLDQAVKERENIAKQLSSMESTFNKKEEAFLANEMALKKYLDDKTKLSDALESELAVAKESLTLSENMVKDIESRFEKQCVGLNQKKDQLENLKEQLEAKTRECGKYLDSNEFLKSEIDMFKGRLAAQTEDAERRLKHAVTEINMEVEQLKNSLQLLREENDELVMKHNLKVEKLASERENLRLKHDSAVIESMRLTAAIEELKRLLGSEQEHSAEKDGHFKSLREELDLETSRKLSALTKGEQLQQELDAKKEELLRLVAEVNVAKKNISDVESRFEKAQTHNSDLLFERKQLEDAIGKLKTERNHELDEMEKRRGLIEQAEANCDKLKEEVISKDAKLKSAELQVEEIKRTEKEKWSVKIHELSSELARMTASIVNDNEEMKRVKEELRDALAHHNTLEVKVIDFFWRLSIFLILYLQIQSQENSIRVLDAEVTTLRSEIFQRNSQVEQLTQQLKEKDILSEKLTKDVEDLENRLKQAEQIIVTRSNQLRITESDLSDRNYTIKDLNSSIDQLNKQLEIRLDEIRTLRDNIKELEESGEHQLLQTDHLKKLAEDNRILKEEVKAQKAELQRANDNIDRNVDAAQATEEVQELKKSLEKSKLEVEAVKSRLDEMTNADRDKSLRLVDLDDELRRYKTQCRELELRMKELENEFKVKLQSNGDIVGSVERDILMKTEQEYQKVCDELTSLKNEFAELTDRASTMYPAERVVKLESTCDELKSQHKATFDELTAVQESLRILQTEKAVLLGKLSAEGVDISAETEIRNEIDRLRNQNNSFVAEIAEYEVAASLASQFINEKHEELQEALQVQKTLMSQIKAKENEIESLNSKLIDLREAESSKGSSEDTTGLLMDITKLKGDVSRLQLIVEEKNEHAERLREELAISTKDLEFQRSVVAEQKRAMEDVDAQLIELKKKCDSYEEKVETLNQELSTKSRTVEEMQESLRVHDTLKSDLEKRVAMLEEENKKLTERLSSTEHCENAKLIEEHNLTIKKCEKLRAEVERLQVQLSNVEQKFEKEKSQLMDHVDREKLQSIQIKELQKEISSKTKQLTKLENQIQKVQEERDEYAKVVEEKSQRIEELASTDELRNGSSVTLESGHVNENTKNKLEDLREKLQDFDDVVAKLKEMENIANQNMEEADRERELYESMKGEKIALEKSIKALQRENERLKKILPANTQIEPEPKPKSRIGIRTRKRNLDNASDEDEKPEESPKKVLKSNQGGDVSISKVVTDGQETALLNSRPSRKSTQPNADYEIPIQPASPELPARMTRSKSKINVDSPDDIQDAKILQPKITRRARAQSEESGVLLQPKITRKSRGQPDVPEVNDEKTVSLPTLRRSRVKSSELSEPIVHQQSTRTSRLKSSRPKTKEEECNQQ